VRLEERVCVCVCVCALSSLASALPAQQRQVLLVAVQSSRSSAVSYACVSLFRGCGLRGGVIQSCLPQAIVQFTFQSLASDRSRMRPRAVFFLLHRSSFLARTPASGAS
jgi:hypothetical protein